MPEDLKMWLTNQSREATPLIVNFWSQLKLHTKKYNERDKKKQTTKPKPASWEERERERETSSLRNGRSTRVNQKGAIKQVGEVVTWVRKVCVGAELMPAWICISCNGLQLQPRGRSKWKTSIDTDRLLCCPSVFSVWFKRPYFPKKKPNKNPSIDLPGWLSVYLFSSTTVFAWNQLRTMSSMDRPQTGWNEK